MQMELARALVPRIRWGKQCVLLGFASDNGGDPFSGSHSTFIRRLQVLYDSTVLSVPVQFKIFTVYVY